MPENLLSEDELRRLHPECIPLLQMPLYKAERVLNAEKYEVATDDRFSVDADKALRHIVAKQSLFATYRKLPLPKQIDFIKELQANNSRDALEQEILDVLLEDGPDFVTDDERTPSGQFHVDTLLGTTMPSPKPPESQPV